MNKKVLIISPYFPPTNAADMHRVRTSLPYFRSKGWDAEVVTIDPAYSDLPVDDLLLQSVDQSTPIHYIKALSKRATQKLGLGSIALRSLYFYRTKVDQLLRSGNFDLIYFSTTQFPLSILGPYWKKKYNIPYVIDMQDPWHSDYYQDKPKAERPPKYWFSYRLNKYLERIALKGVSGLISVSDNYIVDLKQRYPEIKNIPAVTLTFGAFEADLQIAADHQADFKTLLLPQFKNLIYVGRGGYDMHKAIAPLFAALKAGLETDPDLFTQLKLYFIGTSYDATGQGKPTIAPLAQKLGVQDHVVEITDRIGYYHTMLTLQQADGMFICGSDDPKYTASKIYQQLLIPTPVLAIFNRHSSAIKILQEYGLEHIYNYEQVEQQQLLYFLKGLINGYIKATPYNPVTVRKYSASELTANQCALFDQVIHESN